MINKKMINYEKSFGYLKKNISELKSSELIKIKDALGRYVARDIYSSINIPPSNNSAVDGYAYRFKDIKHKKFNSLNVISNLNAGEIKVFHIKRFDAIKISTGAILPKSFDSVVMQENIIISENNKIAFKDTLNNFKGMNVRKRGEDIKKTELVFKKHHQIRPQDIGMLASLGLTKVKVFKIPLAAVFSNGNEVIEPGKTKSNYQIYDSNRYLIFSLLKKNKINYKDFGILKDNFKVIKEKIQLVAKSTDLIIISGGASEGAKDHIFNALKSIGKIKFWKVSIKPGRPFGFGLISNKIPVLMLPGNPVASFVIYYLFAKSLINYMMGNKKYKHKSFLVKSNFTMKKKVGREEFLRGKIKIFKGEVFVNKYKTQGAGILKSIVWSDGLIRLRSNTEIIKKNDFLEFIPFEGF